ncbi:MAG: hypothetical protein ACI865_000404 [Flavobacteriaceae bacterium]|jgi:hypothetical protein
MKSLKFYKTLTVLLVLLNLGTLVFFWFNKPPQGPPKPGALAAQLEIVQDVELVTALEAAHHKEKRKLMTKDRNLHDLLFSKIGSGEDVTALREKITINHLEIETMTYDFFDTVAAYCNESQLKELKSSVGKAFGQLRKPPGKK